MVPQFTTFLEAGVLSEMSYRRSRTPSSEGNVRATHSVWSRLKRTLPIFFGSVVASAHLFLDHEALFWDDWVLFSGTDLWKMSSELGRPWAGFLMVSLSALGPWSYKLVSFMALFAGGLLMQAILKHWPGVNHSLATVGGLIFLFAPVAYSRVMPSILVFHISLTLFLIGWLILLRKSVFPGPRWNPVTVVALLLIGIAIATTGSLGTFFALPFLHLFLLSRPPQSFDTFKGLALRAARFAPLAMIPIGSFVISRLFFKPHGIYENYNNITFSGLGQEEAWLAWVFSAISVISLFVLIALMTHRRLTLWGAALNVGSLWMSSWLFFGIADRRDRRHNVWQEIGVEELLDLDFTLLLILVAAVFTGATAREFVRRGREPFTLEKNSLTAHRSLAFGQLGLSIGVLPYLLVGKTPSPSATDDRLELLLPVSLAFVFVGAFQVARETPGKRADSFVVSIFLLFVGFYGSLWLMIGTEPTIEGVSSRGLALGFLWAALFVSVWAFARTKSGVTPELAQRNLSGLIICILLASSLATSAAIATDWRKQQLIIEAVRDQDALLDFTTIVFIDQSEIPNWDQRLNAIYETTGWIRSSFEIEGMLGISTEHTSLEDALDSGYLESRELQDFYGFGGWTNDGRFAEVVIHSNSSFSDVLLGRGAVWLETSGEVLPYHSARD